MASATTYTQFLTANKFEHKSFQEDCFEWCMKKEEAQEAEEEQHIAQQHTPPQHTAQQQQQQQTGGIIALEMGLGKTIVMLAVTFCNPKTQTLIVVPKSLLSQWKSILEKTTPKPSLFVYHSTCNRIKNLTENDIKKYRIILTTYSYVSLPKKHQSTDGGAVLPQHIPFLNKIKWNRIICDEAHHASHRNTSAFKGIILLNAPIMWMVTGTPIQNKKSEMVNLLRLITKNAPQVSGDDIKQMVYYRTKANVAIEMPPLHQHNIMVECGTTAEEELSRHIHSMVQYCGVPQKSSALEEALEEESHTLTMKYFMLARQACVYPPMLHTVSERFELQLSEHYQQRLHDADAATTSSDYGLINPTDLYTSESKIDSLIAMVSGRINNGCGKIIMCYFHEEMDAIANRLAPYGKRIVKLDGRSTKSERTEALTKPADILIGQIRMCSEGLNLQEHYSEVYFTSPHFNPAIEQQGIARCWRIGQKKEVNVFRFINYYKETESEHTMDTYSEKIQLVKKGILLQFEEEAMRAPMAPKVQKPPTTTRLKKRRLILKKEDRLAAASEAAVAEATASASEAATA